MDDLIDRLDRIYYIYMYNNMTGRTIAGSTKWPVLRHPSANCFEIVLALGISIDRSYISFLNLSPLIPTNLERVQVRVAQSKQHELTAPT